MNIDKINKRMCLLVENQTSKESINDKILEFLNINPNWNGFQNIPNLELIDGKDVIYSPNNYYCHRNKCETNAFEYVKRNPESAILVGGFLLERNTPIAHFWIYDRIIESYLEVTPLGNFRPPLYMGIKLPQLTDSIIRANNYWDVYELKGGAIYSIYFEPYFKNK